MTFLHCQGKVFLATDQDNKFLYLFLFHIRKLGCFLRLNLYFLCYSTLFSSLPLYFVPRSLFKLLILSDLVVFRAEQLNQILALDLTNYIQHETDYIPWRTFIRNMYYIGDQLTMRESYGVFKVVRTDPFSFYLCVLI